MLSRKAESNVKMGGAFPEIFASAICMQNALLSRSGKSLVSASVQGNVEIFAVARQVRPLSSPCGGAARQDVSADWVAYRKANEKGEKKNGRMAGRERMKPG